MVTKVPAAVKMGPNETVYREFDMPEITDDSALIKVEIAGICGRAGVPLLVDEANPAQFRPGANTIVAVDALGAGLDEVVLFCQGSSARQATGMQTLPVDAVIVGIVDAVDVLNNKIYPTKK